MLMTPNRPEARSVTPQALELLELIRQAGDRGTTRKGLAVKLAKVRLSVWDVALLERLEAEGLVKVVLRPLAGRPHINERVYHATDAPL